MARYLVTGGAGFVGSHAVLALLDRGDEVVVLDDLSQGHRAAVPAAATLVQAPLADRAELARISPIGALMRCCISPRFRWWAKA
jgi:UDP-glucose 4-epimerase